MKGIAGSTVVLVILVVLLGFLIMEKIGYISITPSKEGGLPEININLPSTEEYHYYEYYDTDTKEVEQRVDLKQLFLPYFMTMNVSNTCRAGGGTWHEEKDWIGCTGYMPGTIDCSTGVMAAAINQCSAVGADWVCNGYNAYCKY